MKKFLQKAFKITLFQIILLGSMVGIKYIFTTYKIADKIEKPFIWICIGAGAIFVLAISIMGLIDNSGKSFKEWKAQPNHSLKEKLLAGFASWGFAIPIVLAFVLWIYVITPTSFSMAIALYAGIVIRNCIDFFSTKKESQTI